MAPNSNFNDAIFRWKDYLSIPNMSYSAYECYRLVKGSMPKLNSWFDVPALLNDPGLWSWGTVLYILNQYYGPPVGSEYFLYRFLCHVLKTNNCTNNIYLRQGLLRWPEGSLLCSGNQRRMIFLSLITTAHIKFPRGWTIAAWSH